MNANQSMRVARLHAAGDVRLSEEEIPTPGANESLIQVHAVGLCGSDLHWFEDGGIGDAVLDRPMVPGHEIAGVALSGPYEGQLVAVDPAMPCGKCEMCLLGHRNLCPTVKFAGHSITEGGLREYLTWPNDQLFPLPEGMSAADGAVLEPLGVALHAWDLAKPKVGDTIAVIGCGPIGLLMVQLAFASGASRVIAVDPIVHRLKQAAFYGAEVLNGRDALNHDVWRELTSLGVDVAFEIVGNDTALLEASMACRPGGKLVVVGIPSSDAYTFDAGLVRRKGLTIYLVRRMKEMYHRTIELVDSGKIDVTSIVSDVFGMPEAQKAFQKATHRTGFKVVIDPSKS